MRLARSQDMTLYREDFDQLSCDCPACRETQRSNELYFHPRCHPESPTWARYRGDVLTVECAKCRRVVVSVVVASRAHEAREPGSEPDVEEDDVRCP